MSLLLDALKKAEQAKPGGASSLELAGIDNAPAPVRPAIVGVVPGPSLGSAAHRAERQAARAVFSAKVAPVKNRPLWLLLGGLSLLAIAAGAFWLWYTLAYPNPQPAPLAQSSAVTRLIAPGVTPRLPAAQPPAAETASPPMMQAAAAKATTVFESSSSQTQSTTRQPAKRAAAVQGTQLKRSAADTATVSPELSAAYTALARGDYPLATQQYQLVVRGDPFNIDAYLGLATAAASTGDAAAARDYYRKALEIDPKNPVARAGLVSLQSDQNAPTSERELRAQIAASPTAAAPYSALGHIYSSQSRWGDAQQVFFEAYRLEPADPDHAFNLAVSLDHLGQRTLARDYYVKALKLASARPSGFNAADANARLDQLGR